MSRDGYGTVPSDEEGAVASMDASQPKQGMSKKTRNILIGLLALVVVAGVAVGITFAVLDANGSSSHGAPFTFDDIFDSSFSASLQSVRWMSTDGASTYRADNGDIMVRAQPQAEPYIFVSAANIKDAQGNPLSFFEYWISPDESYVLVATDYEQVWRHSFTAVYYVHHVSSKTTVQLLAARIQYAAWAPTGASLAYVTGNDLYVQLDPMDASSAVRVTDDGSLNIVNGIPSWVYEEEVFGTDHSLWWNPTGTAIAFLRFDETNVPIFTMPVYGTDAYPEQIQIKYPKAGYDNPIVEFMVYDVVTDTTTQIENFEGLDSESIVMDVSWFNRSHIVTRWVNRDQNVASLFTIDAEAHTTRLVSTQTRQNGWVDYFSILTVAGSEADGGLYVDLNGDSGWNHIALYSFNSNKPIRMLTSGEWEVNQFAAFDQTTQTLFYFSTEQSPIERHLYSIKLDGSNKKRLTTAEGYYTASFSPDASYYLLTYQGPNVPTQHIFSTRDSSVSIVIEDNAALAEHIAGYALPQVTYMKVRVGDYDVDVMRMAPAGFDEKTKTKHPVLHEVYGGPGSQIVDKRFGLDWHTYLVSSLGYIVIRADVRGTASRGNVFKNSVYKHLGEFEAADQIEVARYFASQSYVDADRMWVWGWSYGGYLTTKILEASGTTVYKGGIAVAPVTDWRLYDTIYTERYMLTPQSNPDGYAKSAVHDYAKFNGTRYMLMHGTADDNVHYQHAAMLSYALTQAGIRFEQHIYTDSNHRINTGANTQPDLYGRITDFIERE